MGSVDEDEGSESGQARELNRPSAYINLATTFLYMTNYYIVGPTSAEVCVQLQLVNDDIMRYFHLCEFLLLSALFARVLNNKD